jgi:hypothetical protein
MTAVFVAYALVPATPRPSGHRSDRRHLPDLCRDLLHHLPEDVTKQWPYVQSAFGSPHQLALFTVVAFGAVGFGDIVPTTDGARLVVMVQIILDLIFIGLVARLLFGAVQERIGHAPE